MSATLRAGARRALPVVPATFALGVSFGVLAGPVIGGVAAVVMSAIVFAGGAQFAAVAVLAGGGGAFAATGAGLLMNARFLPMGFGFAPAFRGRRLWRAVQGQAIVDAGLVLARKDDGTYDRKLLFGSTAFQGVGWVSGTALGVLVGNTLPDPDVFGIDAIFPAFYIALLGGELRGTRARIAALLAVGIVLAGASVLPPGVPVIAASAVALIGLIPERERDEASEPEKEKATK
ncbi:AzlC family ABC transporter permease [Actinomadura rudentiformis]|uniref:Branched-chain amino acid permease n=1 Tax=Actinomadura rudentiformis TaxID=359158 RepID=A0A6H9Z1L0_9ACTN|nr:AzlC family ABC transporter permease [Actinomadura rudentiformis]KAB2349412.1 branched-chain amino acid permease [Actinomadura rudentiformis]